MLEAGFSVTAFESRAVIGGTWNYDEALPGGGSLSYRALKTNTSRRMTNFSDFPFDPELPQFPQRSDVLAYLQAYTDHFDLARYILFQTEVERLSPTVGGRWQIDYRQAGGELESTEFERVILASGYFRDAFIPDFPGLETFPGPVLHSADYTNADAFKDQQVVVVGASSSGSDIAADIARLAKSVQLSARSGVWFTPHFSGGRPRSELSTALTPKIPGRVKARRQKKLLLKTYAERGFSTEELESVLKLPEFTWPRVRMTAGGQMFEVLKAGKAELRPNIERIEAKRVIFSDQSEIQADALIFATGFRSVIPFLDPAILPVVGLSYLPLYHFTFLPDYDNLAVVGFCRVSGPVLPIMEMQSRWAAEVFRGAATLPAAAIRRTQIAAHLQRCQETGLSRMQVQYANFMQAISAKFGVRPKLLKRPALLWKLILGPLLPARYRLDGPGRWSGAEAVIKES